MADWFGLSALMWLVGLLRSLSEARERLRRFIDFLATAITAPTTRMQQQELQHLRGALWYCPSPRPFVFSPQPCGRVPCPAPLSYLPQGLAPAAVVSTTHTTRRGGRMTTMTTMMMISTTCWMTQVCPHPRPHICPWVFSVVSRPR